MHYRDFSIRIEPDGLDGYRAHVLASPAGEGFDAFVPPWSPAEIPSIRSELGRAAQRHLVVVEDDLGHATVPRQLGSELYEALFTGRVGRLFEESRGLIERDGEGLRLKLQFGPEAAWLQNLPWEYLCRPGSGPGSYLGLDARSPIVRYLEVALPPKRLLFEPPLRVLVLLAQPRGTEALDLEGELLKLQSACDRSLVEISVLRKATVQAVRKELRRGSYQAVHFMGHAVFDEASGTGSLLFETEDGLAAPVSGPTLAELLRGTVTPALVVLNACESARSFDLYTGVATALVQAGVSAVVAMQFPISDAAAVTFSEVLYERISALDPVDAAVAEGRLAIRMSQPGSMEWGTPVLFLRSPDGHVLKPIRPRRLLLRKAAPLGTLALMAALLIWSIRGGPPVTDPDCPSPPGLDMIFAKIPGGTFRMGAKQGPKELEPVHEVTIRRSFCLANFEVTQRQWQEIMGSNPSDRKGRDLPVEKVSWEDTQVFLRKLNELDPGGEYRLPTEAEWEYAARGSGEALHGSGGDPDKLHHYGNCSSTRSDGHERTAPVGSFRPTTPWQLYDLHGNVWEWVEDRFGGYPPGPQVDPRGPTIGERRVRRGGSWAIKAENCSAVHRGASKPNYRSNDLGFRVVRTPRTDTLPSITEVDKDLFTIGSGFGAQSSKILHRLPGERVALTAIQKAALSRLLEKVGFTQGADLVSKVETTLIKADHEPDSTSTSIDALSGLTEAKRIFDKFAVDKYGQKGSFIFNLGLTTTTTYRLVIWLDLIEELGRGKGVSSDFIVKSLDSMRELQRPSLEVLQEIIVESEGLLPEEMRQSCNIVATSDLRNRADRERVLDELVKIHFSFGLSLSKSPKAADSAPSYEQFWAAAEAARMIELGNFDEALSLLGEAQHIPTSHFLRAKAYTLRYLSQHSAKRPELDVPGLIRLELEKYLADAPHEEVNYREDAERLIIIIDKLPASTVDSPGDQNFKFRSGDDILKQLKRELKFFELMKHFQFSTEHNAPYPSVAPSGFS